METDEEDREHGWFDGRSRATQWSVLLVLSLSLAAALEWIGIPAALLMGPMVGGILLGTNGSAIRVPRLPYLAAQTIVGCLIARSIDPQIVGTFLQSWPLFLSVVLAVLVASSVLGWLLSRWSVLPGSTAVWGSSPGGATAMMLMAQAFGADAQLVAFMQYMRVVFVASSAALVARFWLGISGSGVAVVWFPPIDWPGLAETAALAGIGGWIGVRTRIPAGGFLVPMVAGAILHAAGLITIELPPWLLATCYGMIGWTIGLGFTRKIILHASRALPQILLSILVLLFFCGGLALILNKGAGIDPLTAYLATCPGGMDSIAIIASSAKVDLPFVMALQTVRFVLVMLLGPSMAKFVARRMGEG